MDLLDRLSVLHGIGLDYYDIWGRQHRPSAATRRALLNAMGIPAGDGADLAALVEEAEGRPWRRFLPEVAVLWPGDAPRLPLTVPAALAEHSLAWVLTLEGGETLRGEGVPAHLPQEDAREVAGVPYVRVSLPLPRLPPPGYHRCEVVQGDTVGAMRLICVPERAYQPEALSGDGRAWGLATQLYAVASRRNWGMGDFTDLKALIELTARQGGNLVGVNPLHALFPHNPGRASPYSPSHRCFVNTLYLDLEAMEDFAECEAVRTAVADPAFQARLRALRAAPLVDYPAVAAVKRPLLERLHGHFRGYHLARDTGRARAFRAFLAEGGERLRRHVLFEALQEHFHARDPAVWGWPAWPQDYQDPEGAAAARFAQERAERVEFYAYLQWQADLQLAAVGRRSFELGLGVGLYQDLAVGADRGGAECWSDPHLYALGASFGAPPDELNLQGQDWGLPPLVPERLTAAAYEPFIAMLRANMRHSGALRIDHVMGLMRLFWVPPGGTAADGAYVSYPFRDLLGIVVLESQRNRCLVVGEDLGTVPDEVRHALAAVGILSCRPFYFERDQHGSFRPPEAYPRQAAVSVSTHDLPTLCGYWRGYDLDQRTELGLFPSEEVREQQIVDRSEGRAHLLVALESQGLLPEGMSVHPVASPDMTPELARAVHIYLARTPSQLLLIQPEDLLGQIEPINLPGTGEERYPNWRRKLPRELESWTADGRAAAILEAVRAVRGSWQRGAPAPRPVAHPERQARVPRATYRLQLNREFTFTQAADIVPYLAALGISHVYVSPILKARPGSSHGYDIIDHGTLNPELGSAEDFERLVDSLQRGGLALMVDVVPNHMGVMGADNGWWLDVLENGPASAYARFFDIDWEPLKDELQGKVLLPVLGDHYGRVLEAGELQLRFDAARGEFSVHYHDHRFPIDPREYPAIITCDVERLVRRLGEDHPLIAELQALAASFSHLPARGETDKIAERSRDKEVHKRHLAALYQRSADIALFLDENVAQLNGTPGDAASFDGLHELVKRQAWRLAYWRVASDDINYRRFFDINDLAGLRMEDEAVFEATHRFLFELIDQGKVEALRIDHPDGLYDPGEYFRRLQRRLGWTDEAGTGRLPAYLVIEKILAEYERLPQDWPVHGTTGYRFANVVNGLFVDTAAEGKLERIYARFVGERLRFDELVYQCKKLIMNAALAAELNVLANRLSRIALASRHTCDFTVNSLRQALAEVTACFPVYRTYVTPAGVSDQDRRYIDWAVAVAKRRSPAGDVTVFDFVRDVLTLDIARGRSEEFRAAVLACAMKVQQFTAPVTAKGIEDTAFYRYHRLVSLNEVGGDPRTFGFTVNAFHGANQDRGRNWPHTMLATSTHDSKRAEDLRARIDVLSEMPAGWKIALRRWSRINRSKKREVNGVPAPSPNDEYLLYQTLIGAWPLGAVDGAALEQLRGRIEAYMLKAVREAKLHTSWVTPDQDYEQALLDFVRALLEPSERNLFLADFATVIPRLARLGCYNSLGQTLIKLTVPGVPDIYQGTELWSFNLVDPDNRRPVDYALRRQLLERVSAVLELGEGRTAALRALLEAPEDGAVKLYLMRAVLALRARHEALFRHGDYLPLAATGSRAEHVCAYGRSHRGHTLVVLVPRLCSRLCGEEAHPPVSEAVWGDTRVEVPAAAYRNLLTGETVEADTRGPRPALALARVLESFPVALLEALG
ncbi:MAG: malto-oligosyltrehalose synthase [Pseudomonadota bacterium]